MDAPVFNLNEDMKKALIITVIILLSGCTETEKAIETTSSSADGKTTGVVMIQEILKNPSSYIGKRVILKGETTPGFAFEFVNEQPYLLNDETGEIWVITSGVMPAERSTVTVEGDVVSPYQIKGRRYEIVVLERKRR